MNPIWKDIALVYLPGPLDLFIAHLELDVCEPRLLVGLPLHPPLEDLSGVGALVQHLLHVGVLVPELVHPGKDGDGTVKDVASVVHLTVPRMLNAETEQLMVVEF